MNQNPDDTDYFSEPDDDCQGNWRRCQCENCQGLREDYADMQYERRRDEELGL